MDASHTSHDAFFSHETTTCQLQYIINPAHCWANMRQQAGEEQQKCGEEVEHLVTEGFKKENGHKWVFPKIGVLQNGWFVMDTPIKMDEIWGYLHFRNPPQIDVNRLKNHLMSVQFFFSPKVWCHSKKKIETWSYNSWLNLKGPPAVCQWKPIRHPMSELGLSLRPEGG